MLFAWTLLLFCSLSVTFTDASRLCRAPAPIVNVTTVPTTTIVPGANLPTDGSYILSSVAPFTILNEDITAHYTVYCDATAGLDSNSGITPQLPLQSLTAAQRVARGLLMSFPTSNIVVLLSGDFYLDQTLQFGPGDSAAPSSFVVWTSWNTSKPATISGGTLLSSAWTLYDSTLNIWKLEVGSQTTQRNLWVDGSRIAKARNINWPYEVTLTPGNSRQITSPFDCSNCSLPETSLATYASEMVILEFWQVSRCPIVITSSTSLVSLSSTEPCGDVQAEFWIQLGKPQLERIAWLEDSLPFLTQPNTWVSNRGGDTMYMIPSYPGFDLNTAQVVAGRLENIVALDGVSNVVFSNLVFQHGDWLNVTVAGMTDLQADVLNLYIVDETRTSGTNEYPDAPVASIIPAAVYCYACTNTVFMHNTFQHLGVAGLRVAESSSNNLVWHNELQDVSAAAIQVGTFLRTTGTVADTYVQDNAAYELAQEYYSSAGIFEMWALRSLYDHNSVYDAAYTGMSMSLGWQAETVPNSANTTVTSNDVGCVMQTAGDGGGIYTNEAQPILLIARNSIHDLMRGYLRTLESTEANGACLYVDNGSQGVVLSGDNVCFGVSNVFLDGVDAQNGYVVEPASSSLNITDVVATAGTRLPLLSRSPRYLSFGGMWDQTYGNPLAVGQGQGCPAGHNTQTLLFYVGYCFRVVSTLLDREYLFGGAYSDSVVNPYTSGHSCPSGFTVGLTGQGFSYCYAAATNATATSYVFGGMYGAEYANALDGSVPHQLVGLPNVLTLDTTCAPGFSTYAATPSTVIVYCLPSPLVIPPTPNITTTTPPVAALLLSGRMDLTSSTLLETVSQVYGTSSGSFNFNAPGTRGSAITFSGNGAVYVPASSAPLGMSFTLSCWFITPSQATNGEELISTSSQSRVDSMSLMLDQNGLLTLFVGQQRTPLVSISAGTTWPAWKHVVVSYNATSSQATIYLNGAQVAQQSTPAAGWSGGSSSNLLSISTAVVGVDYSFIGSAQCLKWAGVEWQPSLVAYVYTQETSTNGCVGL